MGSAGILNLCRPRYKRKRRIEGTREKSKEKGFPSCFHSNPGKRGKGWVYVRKRGIFLVGRVPAFDEGLRGKNGGKIN